MICEFSPTTVHGYIDGELDAVRAGEFERHVESCEECRRTLEQIEQLQTQMRRVDLYERASPQLVQRIRTELALDRVEKPARMPFWRSFLMPALSLAAVTVVFLAALFLVRPHTQPAQITAELVDAHVRSLQPGHLMDVISTDQHTVKPWFDGKIDFIPPVADFPDKGFNLIGGRLDVVDGHNVAVVIYGRAKHMVDLFAWPTRSGESALDGSGSRQGYNWILWHSGDMTLCLVSDTAPASLQQLKELVHP